jgi:hypothetical protein
MPRDAAYELTDAGKRDLIKLIDQGKEASTPPHFTRIGLVFSLLRRRSPTPRNRTRCDWR